MDMFNKKSADNASRDNSSNRSAQNMAAGHNMIVANTRLTGNVVAANDFRIDGEFEGSLDCAAKVIIGEGGRFEGDIKCDNAVVEGYFKGHLSVREVLYVKESAEIFGEVVTGKLVVQSGSIFEVKCKMTDQSQQEVTFDGSSQNGNKKGPVDKIVKSNG